MNTIDIFVQNHFTLYRTAPMTELMLVLTNIFDPSIFTFYGFVLVAILIALVSDVKHSFLFSFAIGFSTITVYLLKESFGISRPVDGVIHVMGHSFPSFHAVISTVFFIIIMYIFGKYLNVYLKVVFNIFSIIAIFAVSFSRVYLGVHWFSDVFFGVIFGAILAHFSIILFNNVINRRASTSMLK